MTYDPALNKLISEPYLALQRQLHASTDYGTAARAHGRSVVALVNEYRATSLLDYGAGKCVLRQAIEAAGGMSAVYIPYDPAFPEYGPAVAADVVACIDVLEHVEIGRVPNVIDHLAACTRQALFATIATGPARRVLADGRNAHLTQKNTEWWLPQLSLRFRTVALRSTNGHVEGIWTPLPSR